MLFISVNDRNLPHVLSLYEKAGKDSAVSESASRDVALPHVMLDRSRVTWAPMVFASRR